jgi:hypothetical protein
VVDRGALPGKPYVLAKARERSKIWTSVQAKTQFNPIFRLRLENSPLSRISIGPVNET